MGKRNPVHHDFWVEIGVGDEILDIARDSFNRVAETSNVIVDVRSGFGVAVISTKQLRRRNNSASNGSTEEFRRPMI